MPNLKERLKQIRESTELTNDIYAELEFDPRVGIIAGISVSVDSGVATLEGIVESLAQKRAVERAAGGVDGVEYVLNDLIVVPPKELTHHDVDIANTVTTVLTWTAGIPRGIAIAVADGTVSLDGTVGFRHQRQDAEDAVRRLVGVREVDNSLVVAAAAAAEDMRQSIEAAIRRRLGRDAVSVAFDDGVVTLSGTVRSWQEQRTAEDAARLSPGLRDVVDRTTIEP